jgi:deoxyribodipyrimidine photo-lyase
MNRFSLMLRRSSSWPLCNLCNYSLCSSCPRRPSHVSSDNPTMPNAKPRILLYILRRDVRLSDNPIFTAAEQHVARQQDSTSPFEEDSRTRDDSLIAEHRASSFTHLLPVYVFPSQQIEPSGFLASPSDKSPYPEARSEVAKVWRTGPHRTRFIAEGVWDLKQSLDGLGCGSGLQIRVGMIGDVVKDILKYYSESGGSKGEISGVWMTANESVEEKEEEAAVRAHAKQNGVDFKLWVDEKYYIDKYVSLRRARSNTEPNLS